MAITKTDFINYIRCPKYITLEKINQEKLKSKISFKELKKEEEYHKTLELIGNMEIDEISKKHLEIMLPYYNEIEILAGKKAFKYFKGTFKYAYDTKEQECFDTIIDNVRYACYVDIYNEHDNGFNIIEVKATTLKKFIDLGYNENGKFNSLFENKNGIYQIKQNKKYEKAKEKLYDKYSSSGHYVYDLAVQRYIIENDLKNDGLDYLIPNIKYYLAVLNHKYIYDGAEKNGKPIYNTDKQGNEIICYIDLTEITKNYLEQIEKDRQTINKYIKEKQTESPIGKFCENKKTCKCKWCNICFAKLPKKNPITAYLDSYLGFKDKENNHFELYDLINKGYVSMLDVNEKKLNRRKNKIQREVILNKTPYIDKRKIKDGLSQIKYPIYHLDFETFPCPLPRYKGEKCYSQSVFQFSLHIQTDETLDKNQHHFGYLAKNQKDHREELIKKLCEYIKEDGTVLVYNDSFEKTRIKELAYIFPEYKNKLMKIHDMIFDLMNIIKTKTSLYENMGYTKEEASMFNYYHEDMNGSFSIKKILPLFSDLSYNNMPVSNGVEALITYATFHKEEDEKSQKYDELVEYCKQDTYAMYLILKGLKELVK